MTIDMSDIEARYRKLPPFPEAGWDPAWFDRLRTWEHFVAAGAQTARLLRAVVESEKEFPRTNGSARDSAPALFDLVLEAFPPPADSDYSTFAPSYTNALKLIFTRGALVFGVLPACSNRPSNTTSRPFFGETRVLTVSGPFSPMR